MSMDSVNVLHKALTNPTYSSIVSYLDVAIPRVVACGCTPPCDNRTLEFLPISFRFELGFFLTT